MSSFISALVFTSPFWWISFAISEGGTSFKSRGPLCRTRTASPVGVRTNAPIQSSPGASCTSTNRPVRTATRAADSRASRRGPLSLPRSSPIRYWSNTRRHETGPSFSTMLTKAWMVLSRITPSAGSGTACGSHSAYGGRLGSWSTSADLGSGTAANCSSSAEISRSVVTSPMCSIGWGSGSPCGLIPCFCSASHRGFRASSRSR